MFASHFSIANIPFGIGNSATHPSKSPVTRIENTVIFLDELAKHGLFSALPSGVIQTLSEVCSDVTLRKSHFLTIFVNSRHSMPSLPL